MIRGLFTLFIFICAFLLGYWVRGIVIINEEKFTQDKQKIENVVESAKGVSNKSTKKIKNVSEKISGKNKDVIGEVMNDKLKKK